MKILICTCPILFLAAISIGCGAGQKKDKDFFTSGNREADQRADQRMAKDRELKGTGEGTGDKPASDDEKKPLYDRLGGADGINAIVDDFVTRALADPRVNFARKGVTEGGLTIHREHSMEWDASPENVKVLKLHLAEFFALATGGPAKYSGKDMKGAHANMHISNAEFEASIGDLKASLDRLKLPNQVQKELLSIVESTRAQIVEER